MCIRFTIAGLIENTLYLQIVSNAIPSRKHSELEQEQNHSKKGNDSDSLPGILVRAVLQKEVGCGSVAVEALGIKPP